MLFLVRLLLILWDQSSVRKSPTFFGMKKIVIPKFSRRFNFVKSRNFFFALDHIVCSYRSFHAPDHSP